MNLLFQKSMSLSQKVVVAFLLIVVILTIFLVGVSYVNWQYKIRYDQFYEEASVRTLLQKRAREIQYHLNKIDQDVRWHKEPYEEPFRTEIHEALKSIKEDFKTLSQELANLEIYSDQVFDMQLILKNLNEVQDETHLSKINFLFLRQVQIDLQELVSVLESKDLEEAQNEQLNLEKDQLQSLIVSLWILAFCLAFVIYVMVVTTREIRKTISQLVQFTEEVAQGKMDTKLKTKGDSDLDMLIMAFNNMSENLAVASDILDERDQLKDEFVSVVSHEIRTPIAILQRVIENLQSQTVGAMNDEQNNMLTIAQKNVQRLSHLIKNLLDMARLESRKLAMNPRPLLLTELLPELKAGFAPLAKNENLVLELQIPDNLPSCFADPELVAQVITNLFNNALRFAKSKIIIEAKESVLENQKAIEISIQDDGVGISEDNQKKLFQKFVQINRQASNKGYKGTGLGLAICKQIVEQHGGIIGVYSRPAEGARFYFALPIQ